MSASIYIIIKETEMKTFFAAAFSFCFVLISAHLYAQEDMSKLKEKIEAMNDTYSKAEIAGDDETILSFYAEDAISLPSYSPIIKGKEAIKESMLQSKGAYKITEFKMTTLDVFGSGDLVYEIGNYNMAMTMPGMEKPVTDTGKYLTVYQKQADGSLKIKAETWNTDLNPWASMGKMQEEKEKK